MQSGIKSKSFNSPLENFNELMFNDKAGEELVNFQAQKDLTSLIKNDETRTVNHDRTTTIDNDETVTVHGMRTETVDKDETITIHQNRTETVDKNETITIHQNRKERVDKDETISIGGNRQEIVEKNETITIQGNRKKTVNGNDTLNVDKDRKENVHQSRSLNVDKNNKEFVKLGKSVTVGLGYATQVGTIMNTAVGIMQAEEVGVTKKTMVGKSYSINVGDEFKITVGKSSLVMKSDGSIIITGSTITSQSERENKVIGQNVMINPPGGSGVSGDEPYEPNIVVRDQNGNIIPEDQRDKLLAGPGNRFRRGDSEDNKDDKESTEQKVKRIRESYEKMISDARSLGADFAANNLQHFIDGKGGVRNINSTYIKQYSAIQDAEERIRGYITDRQLQQQQHSNLFNTNSTKIISKDFWDADIREYNPFSELSYASGASNMRSNVEISLDKNGNGDTYKAKGVVETRWYDDYDWNQGEGFYILGSGRISDDDGIFLKENGGAKDFLLESKWHSSFEGTYNPKTKTWEEIKWKD